MKSILKSLVTALLIVAIFFLGSSTSMTGWPRKAAAHSNRNWSRRPNIVMRSKAAIPPTLTIWKNIMASAPNTGALRSIIAA